MNLSVPFKQVDVFTNIPFKGNPVAVINLMDLAETDLTDAKLQSIANWTNLSETTFLFKPTSPRYDYRLRIFTPFNELPFAGHPTIGSCKAYLDFIGKSSVRNVNLLQECAVGIIELRVDYLGKISFKAEKTDIEELSGIVINKYKQCLGVEFEQSPRLLDVGPRWVVYPVQDAKQCLQAVPNYNLMREIGIDNNHSGVILFGPIKKGCNTAFEMRAFGPATGVNEDPVCGSGSIALVKYCQELYCFTKTTPVNITQGQVLGRDGHISCTITINSDGKISFNSGGNAVTIIDGTIRL